MTYNVLLERGDSGYVATVQELRGVAGRGVTREETLAAVRTAIEQRLAEVEVIPMEVELPDIRHGYSDSALALARELARKRGASPERLTGKPWIDFAGHLADLPDEDWDVYQSELRRIREQENARQTTP